MTQYLYRGAKTDRLRRNELGAGIIPGTEYTMLSGYVRFPDGNYEEGTRVADIPTVGGSNYTVSETPITAGVTEDITQTRRFRGSDGFVLVLNAGKLPFEPIQYQYEYLDANPGVAAHISQIADGELRDKREGLVGTVKITPGIDEDNYWSVAAMRANNIPGADPQSRFADEAEWVAFMDEVSIEGAIEGVVSILPPGSVRRKVDGGEPPYDRLEDPEAELSAVYRQLKDKLPGRHLLRLLVVDPDVSRPAGAYTPDDLLYAYTPGGMTDPEDILPMYRGGG